MRDVSIIGIASTSFSKLKDKSLVEMGVTACNEAIDDAGISKRNIEEFLVGNYVSGMLVGQETLAPLIANNVGLRDIPCTTVEGACSSSSIAFRQGFSSVSAGLCDFVLVCGVEKMTSASSGVFTKAIGSSMDQETEGKNGLTFPGFFGLIMNRHMYEYGTTREQIAMVSVKNRKNAVKNPKARFRKEVSLEEVLSSRLIADPLRLYDCCPVSDGGAAAILCPAEIARKYADTPIDVLASVQTSGYSSIFQMFDEGDFTRFRPTITAAEKAYKIAGMKTNDIDVLELHDCFTIAEIVDSEDLGFFKKGKGGSAIEEGITQVDGKIPINPSGGLLAKGHPVGATGLGQIYEIVLQLRGEHPNQVEGAEIGMTHNMGGPAAVCTVNILKRR